MISLINNNANNLNQMLCHFLGSMILASVGSKLPVQWQAMHIPTKECMKPSPCMQTKSLPFRPIGCMIQRPGFVQIDKRWAGKAGRVSSCLFQIVTRIILYSHQACSPKRRTSLLLENKEHRRRHSHRCRW